MAEFAARRRVLGALGAAGTGILTGGISGGPRRTTRSFRRMTSSMSAGSAPAATQ